MSIIGVPYNLNIWGSRAYIHEKCDLWSIKDLYCRSCGKTQYPPDVPFIYRTTAPCVVDQKTQEISYTSKDGTKYTAHKQQKIPIVGREYPADQTFTNDQIQKIVQDLAKLDNYQGKPNQLHFICNNTFIFRGLKLDQIVDRKVLPAHHSCDPFPDIKNGDTFCPSCGLRADSEDILQNLAIYPFVLSKNRTSIDLYSQHSKIPEGYSGESIVWVLFGRTPSALRNDSTLRMGGI